MLTAATVLGSVAAQMGVSNVSLGLAICAAAIGLAIPTDGGFWLIEKLDNLGIKKTLWSCTGGVMIAIDAERWQKLLDKWIARM